MCQLQSCYSRDVSRMEGRKIEQGGREREQKKLGGNKGRKNGKISSLWFRFLFCFVFKFVNQQRSEVKRSFMGSFSI